MSPSFPERFTSSVASGAAFAAIVVASAYGLEQVRAAGQARALGWARSAGADGFEVRRELFGAEPKAEDLDALRRLAGCVDHFTLVYSAPQALFEDGEPATEALSRLLQEAQHLGAKALKLQLGAIGEDVEFDACAQRLRDTSVRVLVENGQERVGGRIDDFIHFFAALDSNPAWRDAVGMTLDIGNWYWTGESTAIACKALADHVEYVHCKGVASHPGHRSGWRAVPPHEGQGNWREWLASLPPGLPRGMEFPIVGGDPVAATRAHLAALRAV